MTQKITKAMLRAGGKVILQDRGCHRVGAKPEREDYRLALAVYQAMERVRRPEANAEGEKCTDAELGRIAMRFVDRAGDVCEEDPAERICREFHDAMAEAVFRSRPHRRV